MLSRIHRLRKERDIMRVYQKGRGSVNEQIGVKVLASPQGATRVAIVVSKKVDKRAVVRNRNRRRLAGIINQWVQTYQPGYDIVVTVRQDLSQLNHQELAKLVTAQLTGVINV